MELHFTQSSLLDDELLRYVTKTVGSKWNRLNVESGEIKNVKKEGRWTEWMSNIRFNLINYKPNELSTKIIVKLKGRL